MTRLFPLPSVMRAAIETPEFRNSVMPGSLRPKAGAEMGQEPSAIIARRSHLLLMEASYLDRREHGASEIPF